jgi:glycolate oxidase
MLPAAIEMMDNLSIQAAEASVHAGYPDCGGLLLVELDGPAAEVEHLMKEVGDICTRCGAWEIRVAQSDAERAVVWKGRKAAFAAMGRISPNYIVQDGVIPRTALPKVLSEIERMSAKEGLRVANVFHAGDGNLHPLLMYDRSDSRQVGAVIDAGNDILQAAVELGGTISGEHGIGYEKRGTLTRIFSTDDLATMARVREVFDPRRMLNPEKIFPAGVGCGEVR